jgi:hypothetical protein
MPLATFETLTRSPVLEGGFIVDHLILKRGGVKPDALCGGESVYFFFSTFSEEEKEGAN